MRHIEIRQEVNATTPKKPSNLSQMPQSIYHRSPAVLSCLAGLSSIKHSKTPASLEKQLKMGEECGRLGRGTGQCCTGGAAGTGQWLGALSQLSPPGRSQELRAAHGSAALSTTGQRFPTSAPSSVPLVASQKSMVTRPNIGLAGLPSFYTGVPGSKTGGKEDKTRIRKKWGVSWAAGEVLSSWAVGTSDSHPRRREGPGVCVNLYSVYGYTFTLGSAALLGAWALQLLLGQEPPWVSWVPASPCQ